MSSTGSRTFPPAFALLVLIGLRSLGCAEGFSAAVRAYDHALYPEALDRFAALDSDATSFRGSRRARYALYRGLSYLAVGSRAEALPWLIEAKHALEADPRILPEEDLGRLTAAWSHFPEPLALDPLRSRIAGEAEWPDATEPHSLQVPRK